MTVQKWSNRYHDLLCGRRHPGRRRAGGADHHGGADAVEPDVHYAAAGDAVNYRLAGLPM